MYDVEISSYFCEIFVKIFIFNNIDFIYIIWLKNNNNMNLLNHIRIIVLIDSIINNSNVYNLVNILYHFILRIIFNFLLIIRNDIEDYCLHNFILYFFIYIIFLRFYLIIEKYENNWLWKFYVFYISMIFFNKKRMKSWFFLL